MCLYPKIGLNRKYVANKKNKGNVPIPKDKRVLYAPFACGKCMECMKKKSREWNIRLAEEIRTDNRGKFVTLTFNDESIAKISKEYPQLSGYNLDNQIATYAIRHYLENIRSKTKKSVKHWLVTEIGGNSTERLHIHGLLFTDDTELIKSKWLYGHVWIGDYVNESTIGYITKCLHKTDNKHKYYTPIILASKGIGKNYINRKDVKNNKFKTGKTKETYTARNGAEMGLPVYYRNKIYTDEQRENLWIEKLDENIRWVDGVKIDISEDDTIYYQALELARAKGKR